MKKIALTLIVFFIIVGVLSVDLTAAADDANVYFKKGNEFLGKSEYDSALDNYKKAYDLYESAGDKKGMGDALIRIGTIHKQQGQPDDAMSEFERALDAFKELKDYREVLRIHMYIGYLHIDKKKYNEAIICFESALKISREIGFRQTEMLTLLAIADVYNVMAKYEKALTHLNDALVIARETKHRSNKADILRRIGGTYTSLSDHKNALIYYEQALKIQRELGNRVGEAYCLLGIASSKNNLESPLEARKIYTETLKIYRELNNPVGEGLSLAGIGFSYYLTGNTVKMSYYYSKALKIAKKSAPTLEIAKDPLILGLLYAGKEDYKTAVKYLKKAVKKAQENEENINYLGLSTGYLGYSYMKLGKYEKAVKYFEIVINAIEKVRGEIGGEAHRATYVKGKIDAYEHIIWSLIQLKRYEEAFDYMERSRSRSFLDMLGTRSVNVGRQSDNKLIKQEKDLREMLAKLSGDDAEELLDSNETDGGSSGEITTRKITDVKNEYEALINEMQARNPELASLVSVNPMTLKEVQELIPEGTRILEFYTSPEHKLLLFSVTKSDLTVTTIKINKDDLLEKVKELRDSLTTLDHKDFQGKSKKLYRLLLADALDDIEEEKLIIIPHGPLHYLPFSALYDGKQYLVDGYNIVINPSASVLRFIIEKRKSPQGKVMALGNPKTKHTPLPFAEKEVEEINEVMKDVDTYVRNGATETLGKERFSDYRVIHLACHGKFKGEDPLSSALYLAEDDSNDGLLMVHELFGLNLENASLVVLSACETGLSKVMIGDELIGLSRGFFYAGTPSLVVTLWEVADSSTSFFMVKFYENLKSGMDKPTAVRNAQLSLKSVERFSHPFYWAPFVIMGDLE